jgi:hypothetical protein
MLCYVMDIIIKKKIFTTFSEVQPGKDRVYGTGDKLK